MTEWQEKIADLGRANWERFQAAAKYSCIPLDLPDISKSRIELAGLTIPQSQRTSIAANLTLGINLPLEDSLYGYQYARAISDSRWLETRRRNFDASMVAINYEAMSAATRIVIQDPEDSEIAKLFDSMEVARTEYQEAQEDLVVARRKVEYNCGLVVNVELRREKEGLGAEIHLARIRQIVEGHFRK